MSFATKPRAADVARWVAILAEPEADATKVGHHEAKWDRRNRDDVRGKLASWGLGPDGLPKVKAVSP